MHSSYDEKEEEEREELKFVKLKRYIPLTGGVADLRDFRMPDSGLWISHLPMDSSIAPSPRCSNGVAQNV